MVTPITDGRILAETDLATFFGEPQAEPPERSDSPSPVSLSLPDASVTRLTSTLEIKQRWLRSEWDLRCQFSQYIRPHFCDVTQLDPNAAAPDIEKIQSVFHNVRGQYLLWGPTRENAKWTKVETTLPLEWVQDNVEILYPHEDQFEVAELDGIVLWYEDVSNQRKKYQLYDGNHRVGAWVASQAPRHLPAVIFIGRPQRTGNDI